MKNIYYNIQHIDNLSFLKIEEMIRECDAEIVKYKNNLSKLSTIDKLHGMEVLADLERCRRVFVGKLNKSR